MPSLACPCGANTYVLDTRYNLQRTVVRRRRLCKACGARTTTREYRDGQGLEILDVLRRARMEVSGTADQFVLDRALWKGGKPDETSLEDHERIELRRLRNLVDDIDEWLEPS